MVRFTVYPYTVFRYSQAVTHLDCDEVRHWNLVLQRDVSESGDILYFIMKIEISDIFTITINREQI